MKGRPPKTTEKYILQAKNVHGEKYIYDKVIYTSSANKIEIICPEHGSFFQQAGQHLLGSGCPHCYRQKATLTTNEFIEKARNVHGNKYDYSETKYIKGSKKLKIICSIHGVFEQTGESHLSGNGCKKCGALLVIKKNTRTTSEYIEKAIEKHGNKYDYSKTKFTNSVNDVTIICPKHGEFKMTASNHLKGYGCMKCSIARRADKLRHNTEKFIQKAKKVHGDKYIYDEVDYKGDSSHVEIICPIHGRFKQRANDHLNEVGCPDCGHEISSLGITVHDARKSNKEIPGYFYLLKCFNKNEEFFKVGITTKSIKRRYDGNNMPYNFNMLIYESMNIVDAYILEQTIIQSAKKLEKNYVPKLYFGGHTESIKDNPINMSINFEDEEIETIWTKLCKRINKDTLDC